MDQTVIIMSSQRLEEREAKQGQEVESGLTLRLLFVPLLDPALPGFNPIQVVHFGGGGTRRGTAVRQTGPPSTLDRQNKK